MAAWPTASRSSRNSAGSTKASAAASIQSAAAIPRSDGGRDERKLSLRRRRLRSRTAGGGPAHRLLLVPILPQGARGAVQRLCLGAARNLPLAARPGQDQHLRVLARQEP